MKSYDVNGRVINGNDIMMGVIMTTDTDAKRFSAMKQLFDIGKKIIANPNYVVKNTDFTDAEQGIVCLYPNVNTMFCEGYAPTVLYEKSADVQAPTMSTGKIMTILTGLPFIAGVCAERVTLTSDDIMDGSGDYFSSGDVLTVEDLIYGMLLPSSNTCAAAFAHHVGKKLLNDNTATFQQCVNAFYAEMNRRAGILGCENSTFVSASGRDVNNVSTPRDLLKILQACTLHPEITTVWNKKSYTVNVGGTNPHTQNIITSVTNEALEADYYIIGGKTGSGSSGTLRALVMIAEPISG